MTRATLTERLRAHDRLWGWILVPAYLLMMLTVAVGPVLGQALLEVWWQLPETQEQRRHWVLAWSVVACLVTSGLGLLEMGLVRWGRRLVSMKFGLLCPSCGIGLAGYRHTALGVGTCGRCQTQVVEDSPFPLTGDPLPTRDEFLARLGEFHTVQMCQGNWQIRTLVLSFLPGILALWPFAVWVEPCLRSAGLMWLAMLLFLLTLTSPVLLCCYYVSERDKRLLLSQGMVCRWCEAGFTGTNGKTAASTGHCDACGQPAWTDGKPGTADEPTNT